MQPIAQLLRASIGFFADVLEALALAGEPSPGPGLLPQAGARTKLIEKLFARAPSKEILGLRIQEVRERPTLTARARLFEARLAEGELSEALFDLGERAAERNRLLAQPLLRLYVARARYLQWRERGKTAHRGLAREALLTVLRWLVTEHQLHRAYAQLDARNTAVRRLFDVLGFREEAVHKDADWFKGEWTTLVVVAALGDELKAQWDAPSAR